MGLHEGHGSAAGRCESQVTQDVLGPGGAGLYFFSFLSPAAERVARWLCRRRRTGPSRPDTHLLGGTHELRPQVGKVLHRAPQNLLDVLEVPRSVVYSSIASFSIALANQRNAAKAVVSFGDGAHFVADIRCSCRSTCDCAGPKAVLSITLWPTAPASSDEPDVAPAFVAREHDGLVAERLNPGKRDARGFVRRELSHLTVSEGQRVNIVNRRRCPRQIQAPAAWSSRTVGAKLSGIVATVRDARRRARNSISCSSDRPPVGALRALQDQRVVRRPPGQAATRPWAWLTRHQQFHGSPKMCRTRTSVIRSGSGAPLWLLARRDQVRDHRAVGRYAQVAEVDPRRQRQRARSTQPAPGSRPHFASHACRRCAARK